MNLTEKEKFAAFQKEREQKQKDREFEALLITLVEKFVTVLPTNSEKAARNFFVRSHNNLKSNYSEKLQAGSNLYLIKDLRANKFFLEITDCPFIRQFESELIHKRIV